MGMDWWNFQIRTKLWWLAAAAEAAVTNVNPKTEWQEIVKLGKPESFSVFFILAATSMDDIKADLDEMLFGDREDHEEDGGHAQAGVGGAVGLPREKLRTENKKKKS